MKKLLLGIPLGFILNTGLRAYYSYAYWTTEATISDQDFNASIHEYGYPKVVNDRLGIQDYLKYPLITVHYVYKQWEIEYP